MGRGTKPIKPVGGLNGYGNATSEGLGPWYKSGLASRPSYLTCQVMEAAFRSRLESSSRFPTFSLKPSCTLVIIRLSNAIPVSGLT
jgi:hypothetical protein